MIMDDLGVIREGNANLYDVIVSCSHGVTLSSAVQMRSGSSASEKGCMRDVGLFREAGILSLFCLAEQHHSIWWWDEQMQLNHLCP